MKRASSRLWLVVLLGLAPLPAVAADDTKELVNKVQHFYESTTDFTADFTQEYRYAAMDRVQKSSGTVQVKKPGFMRWDYKKPYEKLFLLDGKTLYTYDPDDNSVLRSNQFSGDKLTGAVTFLWGRGKLSKEFDITRIEKSEYGPVVLQLIPRKPESGFTKLFFVVDPESGQVKSTVIFDSAGNVNHVTFSNVRPNTHIPDSRFVFKIPEGAQVKDL